MNNYPTITTGARTRLIRLEYQVLDRFTAKEVLTAILHSILFHRLFGTVKPKTIEVLDVTTPGVSDPDMETLVSNKVDAFWKGVERGMEKRGQITVTFAEKKNKKTWFQVYEEEVPWEQWVINAEIRQHRDSGMFKAATNSFTWY
ncbi:hypothetical protein MPER_09683 [Moniliophthora perniciosa FA553]|nr:hypothetical protein MPER_09683 [Moniliophthora perniciosa FA553]